jgi:RecG-like helicase
MRPAILNPLFAEVAALKGVGSAQVRQLARLKITRALDLAFHLPTMVIDRLAVDTLDESLVGRPVVVVGALFVCVDWRPRLGLGLGCCVGPHPRSSNTVSGFFI